jgi:hypothetical protein
MLMCSDREQSAAELQCSDQLAIAIATFSDAQASFV